MTPSNPNLLDTVDRALSALQSALTAREVYWAEHTAATTSARRAADLLADALRSNESIDVMFLDDRVICGDQEIPSSNALARSIGARMRTRGAECASFRSGLGPADVAALLDALCIAGNAPLPAIPHIRCGSLHILGAPHATGPDTGPIGAGRFTATLGSGPASANTHHIRDLWNSVQGGGAVVGDRLEETVGGLLGLLASTGGAAIPLATLKSHDEYTFIHTTNVAILAGALADAVGLGPSHVRDITIAAVLHDVGKERVPPTILNKAGKLNDAELRVIRQHPVDGAKMLAGSAEVPDVAIIVAYEHHIHPDGTGYPILPPGKKMHLSSRIVQLADVYDALATNRPYRAALQPEQIREIMGAKSGRVYDPDLLAAFFNGVVNRATKPAPGTPAAQPAAPERLAA